MTHRRRVAVAFGPLSVSRDFIDYPYFADLGAVQTAAVVRAAGHHVSLADALALPGAGLGELPSGRVSLGAEVDAVLERIPAEVDATVVAITPFHRPPARDEMLGALLAGLRAKVGAAPIVLADLYQSGQHVVDAAPDAIAAAYPEADGYVRYEAESVLLPLLDELWAREGERAPCRLVTGSDPPSLDALPLPAWDLVDLDAYFRFHEDVVRRLGRAQWAFPIDRRSAPLITSRGCPFRCLHCSSNPSARVDGVLVRPKTQRRYSAAYLDRALADLRARGVRRVHVLDELANVNESHFDALLDLLEKHDLRFEIPNGVRADYVLDRHVAAMRGRLSTLSVSAESGVQRVVDRVVDKQLDLGAIEGAALRARAVGVPVLVHFMIGLPGETREEINGTLRYALRLHEETGAWPSVQFATPLPGTRLAALAPTGDEPRTSLPVVQDFGPRFQHEPSLATPEFSLGELSAFKHAFDRRLEASTGPKRVVLDATYKCNNRCTFCVTGTGDQTDGDFARQRAELIAHRGAGATSLDIDGGEPTLAPHLFAIVRVARALGYERVSVTTNARMASYPEYARKLVGSGVTHVNVSIHGADARTHAENVGVPDAFDETCGGVRNLVERARVERRGVEVGVNTTLTNANQGTLAHIAELVLSLGIPAWSIHFVTPFGPRTPSIAPDVRTAAAEVMRVIDGFASRLRVTVHHVQPCFMPGYERHLAPDPLPLERRLRLVTGAGVSLFDYLRERRRHLPVCGPCPHRVACGGFYAFDDAPEPRWLRPG